MEGVGMTPELQALKTKLRATWIAGDFGQIAKASAPGAEEFIKGLDLQPGMKVLDVACGTGNLAIPAARLGAVVAGVDIAPNLLKQGRRELSARVCKFNSTKATPKLCHTKTRVLKL